MRRVLVLRGGALGDFIVTLPALAALRTRWPGARLELAGNATAAALARVRGLLDAVHSQHEARWSALFDPAPLPAELAAWLGGFDLVVNYWPDPDGALRRHFPIHAGQTFLTADALPSRGPAAAHYAAPLRELGIESAAPFFTLAPVTLRVSAGTVPPLARRAPICVHPGSGSPRKNWPMENWLALIPQLPAPVTVILGEAELPRWSALSPTRGHDTRTPSNQRLEDKPLHVLVQPPLEDLIAHLSTSALFLGHDSGISHLAASGVRCVLLFGPTDPAVWAPPAPNVRVLRPGRELSVISVEAVRQAASALADQT